MNENNSIGKRQVVEIIPGRFHEKLKEWGIHLGVPIEKGKKDFVSIPNQPHIFLCKSIWLYTGNNPTRQLRNVMVIFGHGVVLGDKLDDWVWGGTGKSISETMKVYEDIARLLNWPHVDVVSACRQERASISKVRHVFTWRADLPYIYPDSIVQNMGMPETRKLIPSEGVSDMVLIADRWGGLDWWERRREHSQNNRRIPDWAKWETRH